MASCFHGDTWAFRGIPLGSAGNPHIRAFGTQSLPSKGCDCGHQHTHTNIFTYLGTIVCCIPHVGDATPSYATGTLLPGFHSSRPGYHPRGIATGHPWPRVWPVTTTTPGITTAANVPSLGLGPSKYSPGGAQPLPEPGPNRLHHASRHLWEAEARLHPSSTTASLDHC